MTEGEPQTMAETERNQIRRYGILALEALERDLSSKEKEEMGQIRDSLKLSETEILEKAKEAILS